MRVYACDYVREREDAGDHMDCDFRAAQQEVSTELSSSALIWQVLMAKAGVSQQFLTPTAIPQMQGSPAAKWVVAISSRNRIVCVHAFLYV